jgi:hypothetical protein
MAKLRLSDWASIAEVIGAAAVVISLIYVGVQVRDNTEAVRAANRQILVGRAHFATSSIAANAELAEAYAKVSIGETLTPTELVQFGFAIRAMLYDIQEAFLLHEELSLDEDYWRTRVALFDSFMNQQLAKDVYMREKQLGILHVDFVAWADSTLDNGFDQ